MKTGAKALSLRNTGMLINKTAINLHQTGTGGQFFTGGHGTINTTYTDNWQGTI